MTPTPTRERRVTGSGGIALHVREWGSPEAPTVVLVHGYPDTSDVWADLVAHLAGRFHVVVYDVRGAGRSQAGEDHGGYGLDRLVGDLEAVLDATAPGRRVHLVGHDWGAIQGWEAVTGERTASRIASFTCCGAPCLDHASWWVRHRLLSGPRGFAQLAGQLGRSWYIATFHLPQRIPPASWLQALGRAWLPAVRGREGTGPGYPGATHTRDARRGVAMYRANFARKLLRPGPGHTDVPVQAVVTPHDVCVTPRLYEEMAARTPRLWQRDLDAGHWIQLTHPSRLADWIIEFTDHVETGTDTPALRRARVDGRTLAPFPAA